MKDEHDEDVCRDHGCGMEEEKHAFMLNIEFFLNSDDSAAVAAEIRSHMHNVPVEPVVQSLITVAMTLLEEDMAHSGPMENLPHEAAHLVAKMMARMYVNRIMDNNPSAVDLSAFTVPDDISGLLGD